MNVFCVVMALFLKSSSFSICVLWFSGVATGFFFGPNKDRFAHDRGNNLEDSAIANIKSLLYA